MELRLLDDIELDTPGAIAILNDHSSLAVLLIVFSISFHIFSSPAFVVINTGTKTSGVEDGKANGGAAMGMVLNIVELVPDDDD